MLSVRPRNKRGALRGEDYGGATVACSSILGLRLNAFVVFRAAAASECQSRVEGRAANARRHKMIREQMKSVRSSMRRSVQAACAIYYQCYGSGVQKREAASVRRLAMSARVRCSWRSA